MLLPRQRHLPSRMKAVHLQLVEVRARGQLACVEAHGVAPRVHALV